MRFDPVTTLGIGLKRPVPKGVAFRNWLVDADGELKPGAVVEFVDGLYEGWNEQFRWINAGQAYVDLGREPEDEAEDAAQDLREAYRAAEGQYFDRIEVGRLKARTAGLNPWSQIWGERK